MGTVLTIVIIALVLLGVAALYFGYRGRRSGELRDRFGPEYERTVEESGDRRAAERQLRGRQRRVSRLAITPLPPESVAGYRAEWAEVQQSFVDRPAGAVTAADRLVLRMMQESGYPVDDFGQRVDDISVEHPDVAAHYREAHRVAVAQARGEADTEDLRYALTEYRHLVGALLDDGDSNRDGNRDGNRGNRDNGNGGKANENPTRPTPGSKHDHA
jgi:hypothetical protein